MIKMGSDMYTHSKHLHATKPPKLLSEHVADLEKENEELKKKIQQLNVIVGNANTEIKTLRNAFTIIKNNQSNYGTVEE